MMERDSERCARSEDRDGGGGVVGSEAKSASLEARNVEESSRGKRKRIDVEGGRKSSRWDGKAHSGSYRREDRYRSKSRNRGRSHHSEDRRKDRSRNRKSSSGSPKSTSRSRSPKERRSRDEYRSSSRSDDNRRGYTYDSLQEPNCTIMVRGLASHVTEADISKDVLQCGIKSRSIRIACDHHTGASRGYAFVEFHSVADAKRWMDVKKGSLVLHGRYQASLVYSAPKISKIPDSERISEGGWRCGKCNVWNFRRRNLCHKCSCPRPEKKQLYDEASDYPTTTIMISNLDTLTTEDKVLRAFQCRPGVAQIPIKSLQIARELGTSLSRGICYVKTSCRAEATHLFALLTKEKFEIDGRTVSVNYVKSQNAATHQKNANVAAIAMAAAKWTNSEGSTANFPSIIKAATCTKVKNETCVEETAQYYASMFARTTEEYAAYLEHYRQYYRQQAMKNTTMEDSRKVATQHSQEKGQSYQVASQTPFGRSIVGDEQNIHQYEWTNGYYYDAATGYFYDTENQQYLYWSPQEEKYVAVSGSSNSGVDESNSRQKEKKEKRKDKINVPKDVVKKMEQWAKMMAGKKEAPMKTPSNPSLPSSFLEQGYVDTVVEDVLTTQHESSFTDETKLVCLLCKRQFPCKEILEKHIRKSEMHKKNMDVLSQGHESANRRHDQL